MGKTEKDLGCFAHSRKNNIFCFQFQIVVSACRPRETFSSAVVTVLQYNTILFHLLIQWESKINLT